MSAETRPDPLVPAEVDMRGYEYMPLHGDVLFKSGFDVRATDAEFRAAVNLWWSAWKQRPAASLPNDERELCRLAGLRDLRTWRKVRAVVMEKWVLSADDRLYHPFLADQACSVWIKRKVASEKGANGAKKRWGNNGHSHATGISTAIASAIVKDAPAIAAGSTANSAGNSNRSEVNNPLTPLPETRTSKPPVPSKAVTNTTQRVEEQRGWISQPPPGGKTPSEFLKDAARTTSFEDLKP